MCVCAHVCVPRYMKGCVCVRAQVYLSQVGVCGYEFRGVCVNAESHGYVSVDL